MGLTEDHLNFAKRCQKVYSKNSKDLDGEYFESPQTDCQGSVSLDGSRIIVCFRGSDSLADWKANFNTSLNNFPYNSDKKRHVGFLAQWLSVKSMVVKAIDSIVAGGNIDDIVFTGHSLGGGLSTICASNLYEHCKEMNLNVEVVTFGSPRCGNEYFKEDFE